MAQAIPALLWGIGGAAGGLGFSKMLNKGTQQASSPLPMPQAPSVGDAQDKAGEVVKKKRAAATQSIYTSPLGAAGEAGVARKTLLGQ